MMFAKFFTVAPLFALAVKAVTVTAPSEGDNWATTGSQQVSWESVSTDPSSLSVVLVNDNRLNSADGNIPLIANVSTSNGGASVSPPSGSWPTGQAYRIRLMNGQAILAQSDQFNITSSGTAAGSASASSSSSVMTTSSSMGSATRSVPTAMTSAGGAAGSVSSSAPYTGNYQTTGIPPASSQPANAAGMNAAVNVLALGGAALAALGYLVIGA